ncbi:carbohydrate-binding module family 50 protein [Xylariaceae sp. FL0594]|nr:carbohydrate-binding module family 50 protein [Xylariaceae sp. FL0594]
MSRWSEYDTDAERLPEGMQRIGYDADTQTYTFRDADGSTWESAPGNKYGQLRRVSDAPPSYSEEDENAGPLHPLTYGEPGPHGSRGQPSWRHELMPLLNWFLLVGLFLLFMLWFITGGSKGSDKVVRSCSDTAAPVTIRPGDTCWAIAEERSIPLADLLSENEGLDCDHLSIGSTICVPKA